MIRDKVMEDWGSNYYNSIFYEFLIKILFKFLASAITFLAPAYQFNLNPDGVK